MTSEIARRLVSTRPEAVTRTPDTMVGGMAVPPETTRATTAGETRA